MPNCASSRPLQRPLARLGLLEDLLQHEVRVVAAVVGLDESHGDGRRALGWSARSSSVDGAVAAGVDRRHLAVVEVDDLLRCSRTSAATSEATNISRSPMPITHRAAVARDDDAVGVRARRPPRCRRCPATARSAWRTACSRLAARRRPRSGAPAPRCRSRSGRRAPSALSSARSAAAFSMMPLCTTAISPRAVGVRVGVRVGRLAVRRPARVRDAERALQAPAAASPRGLPDLARRLVHLEPAARRAPRRPPSRSRGTRAGAARRAGSAAASCRPT